MFNHEKDKIGFKELISLIGLMIGTKATDIFATIIFEKNINSAWIVIIGSFLIILPSLIILNLLLKKHESKNLLEITQLALGKHITFIIGFLFFLSTLFNTSMDSRSYMDQLSTMNFPKTPLFLIYILFMLVCMWGAKKGWEALGSVAWMIYPYILIALSILFFLLSKEMVFNRIFPLFGPGKWEVAKSSFKYAAIYADVFVIAMMYPFVKNHKTYSKGIFGGLIFNVSIIAMLFISYALVFEYKSIEKITYPFNEAIRIVSLGNIITNVETFFLTFWLLCIVLKFAVYIYLVCKIFGFVFNIQEFEHTIFPITILMFLIGLIPENLIENALLLRTLSLTYSKYLYLLLPPLLWITIKIKEVIKS